MGLENNSFMIIIKLGIVQYKSIYIYSLGIYIITLEVSCNYDLFIIYYALGTVIL